MAQASVLIPTYNHDRTLPLTVRSVLNQSVSDLEVIIIGDGVTDGVRQAVAQLQAADSRVRFLDRPKSSSHGEPYRHEAILLADSDAIFYVCDDDLLLPTHVADLLSLMATANFAQCMNSFVSPEGLLHLLPSDLSNPRVVWWHVTERPFFNSTSLTGTSHRKSFYLSVGQPWEIPSDGCPPDIYMWRKLMAHPDFRGATSSRVTALQLPTSKAREAVGQDGRAAELAQWAAIVAAPDGQEQIDRLVAAAAHRQLIETFIGQEKLRRSLQREWDRPSRRLAAWGRRLLGRPNPPPFVDP